MLFRSSTAVLLYRMLTGTLPGMQSFPLSLINPIYDSSWDEFFRIGLNWNPAERFQSAPDMKYELNSLQVNKQKVQPIKKERSPQPPTRLRSTPENQCSSKAPERFGLTNLQRPQHYIKSSFEDLKEIIIDHTTELCWQQAASPYPLPWQDASSYIDQLNNARFGGRDTWRLPTSNELLSLLNEDLFQPLESVFSTEHKWFWSGDLHGKIERWYVNLDMGYTATQDMGCLNYIRAVSSN